MAKILTFAGSARKDSFNKKLARVAAEAVKKTGAEVTFIDLADYDMPLYNGDLESGQGLPAAAKQLKQIFIEHDGLLIAAPEYNSSITPLMKNTLDWVSRRESEDEPGLAAYQGKVAALLSTSPGGLGGMRGLVVMRMLLSNLGVLVLPEQQAIPGAMNAFNTDGSLVDATIQTNIENIVDKLVMTIDNLNRISVLP